MASTSRLLGDAEAERRLESFERTRPAPVRSAATEFAEHSSEIGNLGAVASPSVANAEEPSLATHLVALAACLG